MAGRRRSGGEGSIYRRADGRWVGSVSLGVKADGRRARRVVYGASRHEVARRLAELRDQSAEVLRAERVRLAVAVESWLASLSRRAADATVDRYRQSAERFVIPHLGGVEVARLTAMHVEAFYNQLAQAGASADAIHRAGKLLRQFYRHAQRLDLVGENVPARVPLPRVRRKEIRPLDAAQAAALVESTRGQRFHLLWTLALDAGMRQGELYALTWADVDLEAPAVRVTRSVQEVRGRLKVKEVKTEAGRRRIPLTPYTGVLLKAQKLRAGGRTLVFPDRRNGGFLRRSNVRRYALLPALARAGLPVIKFHDLRHTCATLLLLGGMSPKVVAERLGHTRIEVTLNTYAHVLPAMQDQAVEVLARLLTPQAG